MSNTSFAKNIVETKIEKSEIISPVICKTHQNERNIAVFGIVKYWEEDGKLMSKCYLRNVDCTFILIRQIALEVADNIFDCIYLVHDTADIIGLDSWYDIKINHLSKEEFSADESLRCVLLTHFCNLNQLQVDL